MKPLHKSLLIWTTTIMAVLSVLQQQAATFPPAWAAGITVLLAAVAFWRQWLDGVQLPDVSPWRAILTSVPLWCGLGMAMATALQQFTSMLPQSVATALTTVLAVVPVIARGNAALYADPPPKQASDRLGFVQLDLVLAIAVGAMIVLTSCRDPQWPQGCKTIIRSGRSVLQCPCAPFEADAGTRWRPGVPYATGAVRFGGDNDPMPIEVLSSNVSLPIGPTP